MRSSTSTSRDQLALNAAQLARFGGSGWGRSNCPFCIDRVHKSDYRGSFGIHQASGFYHCFRCGMKGRLPGYEDVEYDFDAPAPLPTDFEIPEGYEPLSDPDVRGSYSAEPVVRYLKRRRVTLRCCREARVGAAFSGELGGRVIVPVLDGSAGSWQGYVARLWRKPKSKYALRYKYPSGMRRGELIWNQAQLFAPGEDPVLVCEGVFDAMPLWPDAVATLGKPGKLHYETLRDTDRPLVIVLDGDAWEEGKMLAMRLQLRGHRAGWVRLPPKTDPGDVPATWLRDEAARALRVQ